MSNEKVLENILNNIKEPKEQILKTGFEELDSILTEVENSSIITIAGRPSMGKTAFALTLLKNFCKQNKKCLYLSSRESEKLLLKRMLIQNAKIPFYKINGSKFRKEEIKKLELAKNEISSWDFKIKYLSSLELINIENVLEQLKPNYVFIDDIELFMYDKDWILKELKNLAHKYELIIFITSSLSRRLEKRTDKRPFLYDLKQTATIEDISDIVMMIYREDYYNYKFDLENNAEIIIAKNNFGGVYTFYLNFDPKFAKFSEVTKNYDF